ncbi:MAG: cupin domain-containing protein [Bacteroidota bacterium]
MPFININQTKAQEIWPGMKARLHHSDDHTFGVIEIAEGAVLPEHHHPHVQYTYMLEGQMEFTIGGETAVLEAGMLAHIPSDVPHSATALTRVVVMDTFHPVREDLKE